MALLVFIVFLGGCTENGGTSSSDDSQAGAEVMTCTVSIQCKVLLDNMDKLDSSKHSVVPSDGIILAETTVEFKDGETGADIIRKVTKDNKMQMEFNSGYVKTINNISEMDCGGQSGWKYSVNGTDEGQGCDKHIVKQGDVIEWRYVLDIDG